MGVLSIRTLDAVTGSVVPSRIHLTASDGKAYAPVDAFARTNRAGEQVFHQGGSFRVELPTGKIHVTAVKGFEYWPETTDVDLAAGEAANATIRLERMSDISQ